MNGGTKIVICETIQREAITALRQEGLKGAELIALPPLDAGGDGVHVPLDRLSPTDAICVMTGDCLPSGTTLPDEYHFVHTIRTARAYELVAPKIVLDQLLFEGANVVLPGWVSKWRGYLKVQDENLFRQGFQRTATKIVMLDTDMDDAPAAELREFGRFVRLPYEIVPVGLELFSSRLAKGVLKANLLKEQARRRTLESKLNS
ncbi:MAG: hypothetical protein ABR879_05595 [Methanomassiliicoccales archaeon]|jgi:hypothetical protein